MTTHPKHEIHLMICSCFHFASRGDLPGLAQRGNPNRPFSPTLLRELGSEIACQAQIFSGTTNGLRYSRVR